MNAFEHLEELIRSRRTVKAKAMNGKKIPDGQVKQLLQLADWAPNHGKTEPWRFRIYTGAALEKFGKAHAGLYWEMTPEESRKKAKYEKLIQSAQQASHLIIVIMKRTPNTRIPLLEEIAAVSASVQNVLLGATALNLASIWSTGGMAHHPALKKFLHLNEEDIIMSLLYLGYTDQEAKTGKRTVPLEEKIIWNEN